MSKQEVIEELSQYFKPYELVSEQVYKKYGDKKCWTFFDAQLLETLLIIRRDITKCPVIINNWKSGGSYSQRGLRANKDPMVEGKTGLYVSAHTLGKGIDFSSPKVSANELREKIITNQDLLPYPIRLEDNESAPTWVHFDLCSDNDDKITMFSDK